MFLILKGDNARRVVSQEPDDGTDFQTLKLPDTPPQRFFREECDFCVHMFVMFDFTMNPGTWERCNACDGHGWNWRPVKT